MRTVGCVEALLTEETVSVQTISWITLNLDQAVVKFHQGLFTDDPRYLFLDGVSLWERQPESRKRLRLFVV